MNKILFSFLIFTFAAIGVNAQVLYGVRQNNNSKGMNFKELSSDSIMRLPLVKLNILARDSGALAWVGRKLWVFDGEVWDTLQGGGGGSGEILKAGLGAIKSGDSIKTNYPVLSAPATLRAAASPLTTNLYRLYIGGEFRDYKYNASDNSTVDDSVMVIRSAAGGTYFMQYAFVDPVWYGAIPNDGVDDTRAFQRACDFARLSEKAKKVYIGTIGEYNIANLILATKSGAEYLQFALTIEGAMTSLGLGVTLYNTDINAATIIIQKGKGVDIKNIDFKGVGPDVANYITAEDAQWKVASTSGTIRGNRKSPGQTAIAIDPFYKIGAFNSTILSSGDYYPGLSAWYTNEAYSGTTNVNVNDCVFERLYVGLAEGLSGTANGEGIHINGGYGTNVAYFWAAGQLQSRENTINKFYLTFTHTFLASDGWGTGLGDVPSVNNSNINYCKYLYETYGNFTRPRFNIYSEGLYSLGRHTGSSPVTFTNSTLAMAAKDVTGTNLGMAPVIAEGGPISFYNTSIVGGSYYQPLPFNCDEVIFENCYIQAGLPFTTNIELGVDRIRYVNTTRNFNGEFSRLDENRHNTMTDETLFFNKNESYLLPGGKIKTLDGRTFTNIGERYDMFAAHLDQYNTGFVVTVNTTTQTLTFTAPDPGVIRAGDIIYTSTALNNTNDAYVSSTTALGYVSNITGTTITLADIPAGVTNSGTYQMYILRMPRMVNHTLGTVTNGSNSITSVIHDAGGFEIGDRVRGTGIVDGTYITNIVGTTITISMNATADGTLVELSDAKMKVTADDKTFKYVGGNYNYDNLEVIWFIGDELRNVTKDLKTYGRYCIAPGKTLSGTPPTWYTGVQPDPLIANQFTADAPTESATFSAALGLDGPTINMYGGQHASAAGNMYINFGTYARPIPSTSTLYIRAYNDGTAPILLSMDKLGVTNIRGLWTYNKNENGAMTDLSIPNKKYIDSLVALLGIDTTLQRDTIKHIGQGAQILKSVVGHLFTNRTLIKHDGSAAPTNGDSAIVVGDVHTDVANVFSTTTFNSLMRATDGYGVRIGTGSNYWQLGTNPTFSIPEFYTASRGDITSGGHLYLTGTVIFNNAKTFSTRLGDATSTAAQKSANQFGAQVSYWNGSGSYLRYMGWQPRVSASVNGKGWYELWINGGASGNPELDGGIMAMSIGSDSSVTIPAMNKSAGTGVDSLLKMKPDGTLQKYAPVALRGTPTFVMSGGGTTPTITITGTDEKGEITIMTDAAGTLGILNGTLTFSTPYATTPFVDASSGSEPAATARVYGFRINAATMGIGTAASLAYSTTYKINYNSKP